MTMGDSQQYRLKIPGSSTTAVVCHPGPEVVPNLLKLPSTGEATELSRVDTTLHVKKTTITLASR